MVFSRVVAVLELGLLALEELHLLVAVVIVTVLAFQVDGWCHLFPGERLPVHALEELVLLHFVECDPFVRLLGQQQVEKVLAFLRDIFWQLELCRSDAIVQLFDVLGVVRRETNQELIEDSADLVDVGRLANTFAVQHFWRQISRAAAEGLRELLLPDVFLGESEVCQTAVAVGVNQYVLWFEISVDDIQGVDVLDGQNDLGNEELGLVLLEDLSLVQMVGQVAARAVVENHVEVVRRLEAVVHLDHERMVRLLQDVALRNRVLQVLVPVQERFLQHLHRVDLWVAFAGALEDLAEGTVAQDLLEIEGLETDALDHSVVHEYRLGFAHLLDFVRRQFLPALHFFHSLQIIGKVGLWLGWVFLDLRGLLGLPWRF